MFRYLRFRYWNLDFRIWICGIAALYLFVKIDRIHSIQNPRSKIQNIFGLLYQYLFVHNRNGIMTIAIMANRLEDQFATAKIVKQPNLCYGANNLSKARITLSMVISFRHLI